MFRATTMAQALAQVKKELGANAVILHTRSYKQGGIFGLGAKQVVEVTAGDGRQVGELRHRAAPRRAPVKSASATTPPTPAKTPPVHADHASASGTAGDLIRRTYAAARAELAQAPLTKPNPSLTANQPVYDAAVVSGSGAGGAVATLPRGAALPAAHPSLPAWSQSPATAAPAQELADEMRLVTQMVGRMMRRQHRDTAPAHIPDKLFDSYMNLLKQEVAEELAEQVVQEVHASLREDELDDCEKLRDALRSAVGKLMPIDEQAGKLEPTLDGRPRIIALIGPTGVGKTTTIAKLAATFKLKHKKNVGLITIDTYRIAAVEQLRTYANIIKLPLHVVLTPEEMTRAIKKCAGCDVILLDTAGRSQRDDPRLDQLATFIQVADPHEVHLVLASTCTQPVLLETIRKFSRIRTDRIIFTKLDEAVTFGVLLNVTRQVRKRLSFVTTGQEVPHEIEPGQSQRLASLVMGEVTL